MRRAASRVKAARRWRRAAVLIVDEMCLRTWDLGLGLLRSCEAMRQC